MKRKLAIVSLVIRDYDEAIDFFVNILGFELIEDRDVPEQNKRWVAVAPPRGAGASLLLARASSENRKRALAIKPAGAFSSNSSSQRPPCQSLKPMRFARGLALIR